MVHINYYEDCVISTMIGSILLSRGEKGETLPGGGFHGGKQEETLPGGGFHGGEQEETLPGGGFHGGEQEETLPGGGFHHSDRGILLRDSVRAFYLEGAFSVRSIVYQQKNEIIKRNHQFGVKMIPV